MRTSAVDMFMCRRRLCHDPNACERFNFDVKSLPRLQEMQQMTYQMFSTPCIQFYKTASFKTVNLR